MESYHIYHAEMVRKYNPINFLLLELKPCLWSTVDLCSISSGSGGLPWWSGPTKALELGRTPFASWPGGLLSSHEPGPLCPKLWWYTLASFPVWSWACPPAIGSVSVLPQHMGVGTVSRVPPINQSWLLILFLRYSCLSVCNCCSLQSS